MIYRRPGQLRSWAPALLRAMFSTASDALLDEMGAATRYRHRTGAYGPHYGYGEQSEVEASAAYSPMTRSVYNRQKTRLLRVPYDRYLATVAFTLARRHRPVWSWRRWICRCGEDLPCRVRHRVPINRGFWPGEWR